MDGTWMVRGCDASVRLARRFIYIAQNRLSRAPARLFFLAHTQKTRPGSPPSAGSTGQLFCPPNRSTVFARAPPPVKSKRWGGGARRSLFHPYARHPLRVFAVMLSRYTEKRNVVLSEHACRLPSLDKIDNVERYPQLGHFRGDEFADVLYR